jgi:hypothetical protein
MSLSGLVDTQLPPTTNPPSFGAHNKLKPCSAMVMEGQALLSIAYRQDRVHVRVCDALEHRRVVPARLFRITTYTSHTRVIHESYTSHTPHDRIAHTHTIALHTLIPESHSRTLLTLLYASYIPASLPLLPCRQTQKRSHHGWHQQRRIATPLHWWSTGQIWI